ncbi:DUF998 domain-containing protein [Kribbella sp. NBC_01484]|uniref:DUF998 domain-containing protein n=1 Tax=Kribbella sp. NBC_01484 TaxID=2903579 RepID=UPI002E3812D7|nr:DUF998 domain-containing protein [Kribbella sp. NBC_01484]
MNTRTLLAAGVIAGPLFVATVAAQLLTRDGFDITHQPMSLLSVGDQGWIQITNFVVAGVLACVFAGGLKRSLQTGRGTTWAPRFTVLFGIGLIAGGVFPPDAALGYPIGTPDEIPADFTWHGTLHAFAPPLAFTSLVVVSLILAGRFKNERQPGWSFFSAASGVVSLTLSAWPDPDSSSWRLAISVLVGFAWFTALALQRLHRFGHRVVAGAVDHRLRG